MTGAVSNFTRWAPDEDTKLRAAFPAGGARAVQAELPHRSRFSILNRARAIGLNRRPRWTATDDARLEFLWNASELSLAEIALRLKRSPDTTYWRAQQIGLPLGVPEGWERLSHAAERTGYSTRTLRRILAADEVVIRRSLTKRDPRHTGARPTHIVPINAVNAAVEAWIETEPLHAAAQRLGMSDEALRLRLNRAGIVKPGGKNKLVHWRVRPEEVEMATAWKAPVKGRAQRAGGGRFVLERQEAA